MAAFNTPAIPLPSVVVVPNNETVGGTLLVTGATTLGSTLAVTGNETVAGTLGVTGATTLSSTVATGALTVTGAATVSTTLGVTGATTLSSTLGVTGVTTVAAGSAAAPAVVSVTGTADTGVFFPAADTIAASTAGSERLRIDSSGNVGIGATSPTYQAQVNGSGQTTAALTDAGAKGSLLYLQDNGVATGNGGGVLLGANSNTPFAAIKGLLNNGAAQTTGNLAFSTRNATADVVLTERMRITNDGYVGIGTASPTATLSVQGPQTTSTLQQVWSLFSGVTGAVRTGSDAHMDFGTTTPHSLHLMTNGTRCVSVTSGGNVGIGTTSPSYLLHVNTDSAGKPGVGGLWTVVSDERIKTDIVPADLDRCYEIVKSVPLKHFGFKPGVYTDEQIQDKHSLGWIAQDVQQVFEKAVSVKPFTIHTPQADGTVQDEVIDDCLDLNSGQMIAALYGCVQALMAKVEALEARG